MKIKFWNKLVDRARTKKDGVWSYQNVVYAVKNGNIGYYAEGGKIFQVQGMFSVEIGKCNLFDYKKEITKLYNRS